METATKLTPAQLHILQLFNRLRTKSDLEELKKVLLAYYQKKVDSETEKIWKKKKLSKSEIDAFLSNPKRTPYQ